MSPTTPPKFCAEPGCQALVTLGYCSHHQKRRDVDLRGSASSRGYGRRHERWRAKVLRADPVCHWPEGEYGDLDVQDGVGTVTLCRRPATVADHIIPWRLADIDPRAAVAELPLDLLAELELPGDLESGDLKSWLRFSLRNGQGLCHEHHNAKTAEERRGIYRSTRR